MHRIYIEPKKWKNKLNKIIERAKNSKMPDTVIERYIKSIISFTILTTLPDTESEKLFYELWKKADKKEKNALTKTLIKIIKE